MLIDYLIFCIGLYSLVEIIDCRACIEELDSSKKNVCCGFEICCVS